MKHRKWDGGHVHRQSDGRDLYVIEKQIQGKRYHVSTRAHSYAAAMEQLKRFESNPDAYAPGGEVVEGLRLTADLVLEFRQWLLNRKEPRPTTTKHANEMAHRLNDWVEDLAGRDLRKLELSALRGAIAGRSTCRQHRVIAIKGFFAWLREQKGLLRHAEDPTLDLPVPQGSPEKYRRRKAVALEHVRAVMPHLAPAYRDCLLFLGATGWHVTELGRFAKSTDVSIADGRDEILAVLQVPHKSGDTTRTPVVDAEVLAAAKRIRERGGLPRRMNAVLRAACDLAEVPRFGFGVMRHTVGTWAKEAGTDAAKISEFLGHRDPRTTKRFYMDVAIPTTTVRLPRLT